MTHSHYMQQAINLAKHALGNTGDNPPVGCIIVANDQIIGCGYTQKDGRHAEVMALEMAQKIAPNKLEGASVYVTLEPCAHFGRTPPCANALVDAKIANVYIAITDPDLRVAGKGVAILKANTIKVTTGLLAPKAEQSLKGFLSRITTQKPHVMLKLAMSKDGYITRQDGSSKWITSPQSRHYTHLLRAQNDAILIGINTALADNPMLDCRLKGLENRSPIRVVLDSKLRLNPHSALAKTAHKIPTILFTEQQVDSLHEEKTKALTDKNVRIHFVKKCAKHLDLNQVLTMLAQQGINRLMIEGGAQVASAFVKNNLIDELNLFFAPEIIGEGGKAAIEGGIQNLLTNNIFTKISSKQIDIDKFEQWQKQKL